MALVFPARTPECLPEAGWGYVTDPVAGRFFEGLLSQIEAYVSLETRSQQWAFLVSQENESAEPGNNGAEYLDAMRRMLCAALEIDPEAEARDLDALVAPGTATA
jgi:hypothetical protein